MVTLRNASDAWVNESRPNKVYANTRRLYVKASGGDQRFAYIFFARPFPMGATILSAKFRVYNGSTLESGATLSVNRIKDKWSKNRVTWNKKPAVFSTTRTVTKSGNIPPGTEWELDVTPIMQSVADGGVWYGFRITCDDGVGEWFYSAQGKEKYRPTLEVTWSDAPEPPEDLAPAGGRAVSTDKPTLRFDFTDVSGDTDLAAVKIEIGSTKAKVEANTAEWKSPELPASEPEVDLATTTYPGLANNGTAYWRVMVKDGAGIWSDWSDVESFTRVDKGTITLNNPPISGLVGDSTPSVFWTFSGVQVAYQVIVALADEMGRHLWNSGKITDTTQDITIPDKIIKRENVDYNIRVRVWDSINREKEGDRPIYSQVSRNFRYDADLATAPVSNLVATPDTPWPWMKLTWTRADAPDRYEIWRGDAVDDMEVVAVVDSDDAFVSGTSYQLYDRYARGRVKQYWKVVPVVNGKAAKNNPVVNGTPRAASKWLMEEDGSNAIMLVNASAPMQRADGSTVHMPLNGEPVLVSQVVSGLYSGEVQGMLADEVVPGLTASQMEKRWQRMIKQAGQPLILFNVDKTYRGFITQPTINGVARPDGSTEYVVQFNFYEMGEDA